MVKMKPDCGTNFLSRQHLLEVLTSKLSLHCHILWGGIVCSHARSSKQISITPSEILGLSESAGIPPAGATPVPLLVRIPKSVIVVFSDFGHHIRQPRAVFAETSRVGHHVYEPCIAII